MTCDNCTYFLKHEIDREKVTECTRFPPVPLIVPIQTLQGNGLMVKAVYPPVMGSSMCGEFKLKEGN